MPGNDDTGTMSAWLVCAMMGVYPVSPATPVYTITTPRFDKITIALDTEYYNSNKLVIERDGAVNGKIKTIKLNGKSQTYFIDHKKLVNGKSLRITTE